MKTDKVKLLKSELNATRPVHSIRNFEGGIAEQMVGSEDVYVCLYTSTGILSINANLHHEQQTVDQMSKTMRKIKRNRTADVKTWKQVKPLLDGIFEHYGFKLVPR